MIVECLECRLLVIHGLSWGMCMHKEISRLHLNKQHFNKHLCQVTGTYLAIDDRPKFDRVTKSVHRHKSFPLFGAADGAVENMTTHPSVHASYKKLKGTLSVKATQLEWIPEPGQSSAAPLVIPVGLIRSTFPPIHDETDDIRSPSHPCA